MASKEKHRKSLLDFLGDPENDFPSRIGYADITGISMQTLYHHFSPDELSDIENEAVEIRKRNSSKARSEIMQALTQRAKGYSHKSVKLFKTSDDEIISEDIIKHYPPDAVAAREFLDRTEGKVADKIDIGVTVNIAARLQAALERGKVIDADTGPKKS